MEEPLFNQLRTQEQLGYSVFCLMRDTFGIFGYSVTVCTQADKFTTEHIDDRIETFLKSFMKILKKMSDKELNEIKIALVKLKQCVDLHLKEEVGRNWSEIVNEDYIFDRQDREINAINGTKIVEIRKWMEKHVLGGANLRKLTVQVLGKPGKNDEGTEMSDSSREFNDRIKFPLEFVKDTEEEKKAKPAEYYITDIEDYKKNLNVYPANATAT